MISLPMGQRATITVRDDKRTLEWGLAFITKEANHIVIRWLEGGKVQEHRAARRDIISLATMT